MNTAVTVSTCRSGTNTIHKIILVGVVGIILALGYGGMCDFTQNDSGSSDLKRNELTATAVSSSEINLFWDDNYNNEDGFAIQRSTDGISFTEIATVAPNATTYPDTGLSEGTLYYYLIRVYNITGDLDYLPEVSVATFLNTPTSLTAATISSSRIDLTWQDNPNTEDGFRIERKMGATGAYIQIDSVGNSITSYSNTRIPPLFNCSYRVCAYNSATVSSYSNPASATTTGGWTTVSSGYDYSLAISTDGTLWGWGQNYYGYLWQSDTIYSDIPTKIGNDADWTKVSAGGAHCLAIKTDGTLWAWGKNDDGQLGLDDIISRTLPAKVISDTDWAEISAGGWHSVSIKTNGTLWAWGSNVWGQIGIGSYDSNSHPTPVQVVSDTSWANVTAGPCHTIARKTDKTLWSWGRGGSVGQLGLGTTDDNRHSNPAQIGTDTDWVAVETSLYLGGTWANHSIARKNDGSIWAWGWNYTGQLGLGDTGNGTERIVPTKVGTDTDWTILSSGSGSTAVLKTNGTLWMCGDNSFGQLGLATKTQQNSFVQVGTDTDWVKAYCGGSNTFAIKANGTLWAWGRNDYGKLGFSDTNDRLAPTRVGE